MNAHPRWVLGDRSVLCGCRDQEFRWNGGDPFCEGCGNFINEAGRVVLPAREESKTMANVVQLPQVSLWAHGQLKLMAAGKALTYLEHLGNEGLIGMGEFNEMERWRKLSADLDGKEFEPFDPARAAAHVRGWDPEKVEAP